MLLGKSLFKNTHLTENSKVLGAVSCSSILSTYFEVNFGSLCMIEQQQQLKQHQQLAVMVK